VKKHILAADIGGTNSRFAHFTVDTSGVLSLVKSRWIETARSSSFAHLLQLLNESDFATPPGDFEMSVLAVAGPVTEGVYSKPPNISWDIDIASCDADFGLKRCILINDFAAQAYACRSPIIQSARQVVDGTIDPTATLAVIGAGTGLGMAALTPDGCGGFVAVPSEGGHGTFPFETRAEIEFMQFITHEFDVPYVEAEYVVSGRGLSIIHQFLTGKKLAPAEVGAGLSAASETLAWTARFYGRICRNFALQVLARGGVYIAGGVAAKHPALITHPEFQSQFCHSETMKATLQNIPVFLNTNEESGLWGAAFRAAQDLRHNQ
jgi:glucokinase